MLVKTFRAGDMSEALKMVKAELGADAMIISSRQEKRKGLFRLFSKPFFEVTAALEPRPAAPKANPYRQEERELTTREEFQKSMLAPLARELRDLRDRVELLTERQQSPGPVESMTAEMTQVAVSGGLTSRSFSREELDEIKQFLLTAVTNREKGDGVVPVIFPVQDSPGTAKASAVVSTEQAVPGGDAAVLLDEIAAELRRGGLDDQAVEVFVNHLKPAAEGGEDREELRYALMEAFATSVKCAGPLRTRKNGQRIIALVGPTGVGKTTTIAKLAAMFAMNKGASVALVTTDNFRVGAVEQLRTYSRIMGLPLEVVANSAELTKSIADHSDKELVLIDTTGRSPRDEGKVNELKELLDAGHEIEIHLCLAATTRDRELDDIVSRFASLPISRILFTKLDEAESLGCIVNCHLRHRHPLSYVTNGQMVPEDIAVASPRKLANLILRGAEAC